MSCEGCKKSDLTEETKAVRGASEIAQRYKLLCGVVVALAIGFAIMAGCMVYTTVNSQRIVTQAVREAVKESQETMNAAVMKALETVAEMEVVTETTTVTQDTGEGEGNNIYQQENGTYNEGGGG